VFVAGGSGNMIGINGAGNTIMGNTLSGIDLQGASATGNTVLANTIQGNGQNGVYVFNAPSNTVGGSNPGDGNTISGNGFNGVELDSSGTTGNLVVGNTISNQSNGYGVLIDNGATANTIGGSGGAANTLSNNAKGNIQVLINGLPPSNGITGGNNFAGNNAGAAAPALTTAKVKHRHHALKAHHVQHHPKGPRHHAKKKGKG
jgi:parallel beta-helix repeat protein